MSERRSLQSLLTLNEINTNTFMPNKHLINFGTIDNFLERHTTTQQKFTQYEREVTALYLFKK